MAQIVRKAPALRLLDRQTFTANGTWNKPADFAGNIAAGRGVLIKTRLMGGGGAGGGGNRSTQYGFATGGLGGEIKYYDIDIAEAASTETVTIGAQSSYNADGNFTEFMGRKASGGKRGAKYEDDGHPYTYALAFPAPTQGGLRAGDGGSAAKTYGPGAATQTPLKGVSLNGYGGAEGTGPGGNGNVGGAGVDAVNPGSGGGATCAFSVNAGRGARGEAMIEVWGY